MLTVGDPPYLECSTRGDRRFSPFCALVGSSSIEEAYHAHKILRSPRPVLFGERTRTGLSWREAKNLAREGWTLENPQECAALYSSLWDSYMRANPDLLPVIVNASGLSDMFGQPSSLVCQVTELWRIRRLHLRGKFLEPDL